MKKLFVFMIDALCASDIEKMKEMPNFSKIINNGSYVASLEPVWPALTYSCHTSIVTGTYVDRHSICNNEVMERGCKPGDVWYGYKSQVKDPTILDYARENGLTTASIAWPVSAGANYTYNWPMIVPYKYKDYDAEKYLYGNATDNLLEKYFWKYGLHQKGPDAELDRLTMAVAPDLIRDFGQPDVMFVKMCDLDTQRHNYGVYSEETYIQLRRHDLELGVLLESIKRYGDYENTNFVIMGDHGQTNIEDVLNINVLLKQAGFIRTDENGEIIDCDCYAHSTALTCCIELKNPDDKKMAKKVKDFLLTLKEDKDIQLRYVYDKEEMKEIFRVDGPFDFITESNRDISFSDKLDKDTIWASTEPGDHKIGRATHGSRGDRKETTLFIASGPSVKKGVVIEKANMVDEAVTMAKMIGFDMPNTDGRILHELLVE